MIAVKAVPILFHLLQERSFSMMTEATTTDNLIETIDQARDLFESRYDELTARAEHYFRALKPEAKDDAVSNTMADTWFHFRRLVERAIATDTLLTTTFVFACKHTRAGRNSGNIKSSSKKELFNHAKRHNSIIMETFVDDHVSVFDAVSFKVDTEDWIDHLSDNHRARALDLASGESPSELATRWRVSRAAVTGEKRYLEASYTAFMED